MPYEDFSPYGISSFFGLFRLGLHRFYPFPIPPLDFFVNPLVAVNAKICHILRITQPSVAISQMMTTHLLVRGFASLTFATLSQSDSISNILPFIREQEVLIASLVIVSHVSSYDTDAIFRCPALS